MIIHYTRTPLYAAISTYSTRSKLFSKTWTKTRVARSRWPKTKKLFQQINQNFNTAYTSADAKRLFEKCSKNEEGAISLEDFKKEFVTIEPTLYQGNEFE